jgi:hypothetical protein
MRRILKHPTAGVFRSTGPTEWPMDTYTHRRLEDGSITLDEEEKKSEPPRPRHAATQS